MIADTVRYFWYKIKTVEVTSYKNVSTDWLQTNLSVEQMQTI